MDTALSQIDPFNNIPSWYIANMRFCANGKIHRFGCPPSIKGTNEREAVSDLFDLVMEPRGLVSKKILEPVDKTPLFFWIAYSATIGHCLIEASDESAAEKIFKSQDGFDPDEHQWINLLAVIKQSQ